MSKTNLLRKRNIRCIRWSLRMLFCVKRSSGSYCRLDDLFTFYSRCLLRFAIVTNEMETSMVMVHFLSWSQHLQLAKWLLKKKLLFLIQCGNTSSWPRRLAQRKITHRHAFITAGSSNTMSNLQAIFSRRHEFPFAECKRGALGIWGCPES